VIGNAGSILAFRLGAEDAPLIADELGIESKSALTDTPNFALWAKLLNDGVPGEPRPIATLLPAPLDSGTFQAVCNRSRARTTRPRDMVEEKIKRFLAGT
jgi:hypothetical protein